MEPIEKKTIDQEIDHILSFMEETPVNTDDYGKAAESLRILCEARSKKTARRIEWETVLTAGTSILSILLMLNHERLNVISTKAMGLLIKPR